jgi:hypothetical protein
LKTLLRITLLLLAAAGLPRAVADDWTSEKHLCALTIPTTESWTAGMKQALPVGEVILHAISMDTNEGIQVTFVPEMPTTELRDPDIEKRIQELLILQGWTLESGLELKWQDRQFLQFVGRRRDAVFGQMVGVSRATIRKGDLYVVTAYARGETSRVNDPKFMRIMNTFHLLDRATPVVAKPSDDQRPMHKFALLGTVGAAGLLLVAFAVMMYRTRHGFEGAH